MLHCATTRKFAITRGKSPFDLDSLSRVAVRVTVHRSCSKFEGEGLDQIGLAWVNLSWKVDIHHTPHGVLHTP